MSLAAGTRLGPYEITEQIGIGGMGEVYRARDVNLGRDVAIKVLPEAFAQDADRLARFEREARTLASLSHPNVATVHGFEKADAVRALVMEFVGGPTLADRIAQGPIPIDEALPIARQIAEAVEAAHEQGIIHRDLKPANIKVRDDGTVKVLDFGLAKMYGPPEGGPYVPNGGAGFSRPSESMSPTITTPAMTQLGMILGTAAYMAPEQARGKALDKRTDIWAFGCVLFEMLTGTRAFDGEDATDTIAAVVRAEPKWDALPADVPAPIRLLLRRCLEKDRKKRIADISTALFIMSEQTSVSVPAAAPIGDAKSRRTAWRYLAWLAVAVVVATAATENIARWMTRPDARRVSRLEINTSGASRLALYINNMRVAIAADGSRVVYPGGIPGSGAPNVFSRRLDQFEPSLLAERGYEPFLSPDGRWLGFATQRMLRKVAVTGGSALDVTTLDGNLRGATWGTDGTIVFATLALDTGLLRISNSGGQPQVLTRPAKGEGDHVLPRWLPGGKALLFTIQNPFGPPDSATSQIAVLDMRSPGAVPKIVLRGGSDAHYVPTGHLVYLAGDSLWAVPFDLDRLEVKESTPTRVLAGVSSSQGTSGVFDVAGDGTLVYLPRAAIASPERQLVWIDRQGKEEIIPATPKPYAYPRISPDSARIAVDIREQENDIWTWDLSRRGFTRVTTDPNQDRDALWLDAEHIIYSSMIAGNPSLFLQRADGIGAPEQLSTPGGAGQFPTSLSPDKQQVVFIQSTNGNDLMLMHLDRPASRPAAASSTTADASKHFSTSLRDIQPLVSEDGAQVNGVISPDGRWLAYQSNESGRFDIYVRAFPDVNSGIRHTVSNNGGTQPRWSRDGRELFYADLGTNVMMSVRVGPGSTWSAGTPEKLFDATKYAIGTNNPYLNYDVAKDGRFLMVKPTRDSITDTEAPASLVVEQNWFEELKRLVPAK